MPIRFSLLRCACTVTIVFLANAAYQPSAENDFSVCNELHAKLERLHSEITSVRAELASHCSLQSHGVAGGFSMPPLPSPPSHSNISAAGEAGGEQTIAHDDTIRRPARRSGDRSGDQYSTQCWAPGSAFVDPSCNCLGQPAHPMLGSRRTVKVVVGSW
jgi:hypothetical protein